MSPTAPYYGLAGMYWHKLRQDDLNAFYGANYPGGTGTTSIDVPGNQAPGFPAFVGATPQQAHLGFMFPIQSANGTTITLDVQWSASAGESTTKHKVWRLKYQHKPDRRPNEWQPGGPRLPATRMFPQAPYLFIFKDTAGTLHARVLFDDELESELFDLAVPIRQSSKSSGVWP